MNIDHHFRIGHSEKKNNSKALYVSTHYICYNLAAKSKDEVAAQPPSTPPKKRRVKEEHGMSIK